MDETNLLREAVKYLWGLLVPAGLYIWKQQDSRIKNVEDRMYTKEDARERLESVDETLEARRQDVIALHDKLDHRASRLDDKMDVLVRDMHKGFSDRKDMLLRH